MYITCTNDYPGNNKKVSDEMMMARSARIDSEESCNPCDDTYLIADEFGVFGLAVTAVLALLV
jgi:hypothetical protein